MRLLILGGTLFLGRHLAQGRLRARGDRCLSRQFLRSAGRPPGRPPRPHEPLRAEGLEPWEDLPLWLDLQRHPEMRGFMAVDVSRALAEGLAVRPLEETVRDITGG